MKPFTLHFDTNDQCDTLDRAWFDEMWFPVQKHTYHVQSSVAQSLMTVGPIQQIWILMKAIASQTYASLDHKCETLHMLF